MRDTADQLLYALSAWEETSWARFVTAFDQIAAQAGTTAPEPIPLAVERWRAIETLTSLGHVETLMTPRRIVVAPAVLAQLPTPGRVRAVLCGRRAPNTVLELRAAAQRIDPALEVRPARGTPTAPFAPTVIEVKAYESSSLAAVAADLGIAYADTPPAWVLLDVSVSVPEYIQGLEWGEQSELNWEHDEFSPRLLRMARPDATTDHLRLVRYLNPVTRQPLVLLWDGPRAAAVDLDWGRFAVLARTGTTALTYDARTLTLHVPWGLSLPRLLARALVLCTGRPPARVNPLNDVATSGAMVYGGVPPDVAESVMTKLGQGVTCKTQ